MKTLNLNDGLNTLFLHFMYFVQEFKLLDPKEWSCLDDLLKVLIQLDKDLAKNPPVEEFEGLSMRGGRGKKSSKGGASKGGASKGGASNPA